MQQHGKIIAVDGCKLWVDVSRQNACMSCAAKNGCGTSLLERALPNSGSVFELAAPTDQFTVGETVDIAIDESKIVGMSLLIYGLPLLCLLLGAVGGNALWHNDGAAIAGALLGFGAGFGITRVLDATMAATVAPTVSVSKTQ